MTRTMSRTILSSLLLAFVAGAAACGGADKPATAATTTTGAQGNPAATTGSPRDTCVATFTRQRECTDIYLPALVDARVANDLPAGIAAKAAEPGGRDEILATAQTEWATDSTDASIGATCDGVLARMPPEQVEGMTGQASQCLAAETCQAFVDCVIPMTVAMWKSAPAP
jgi:hypothetical protein